MAVLATLDAPHDAILDAPQPSAGAAAEPGRPAVQEATCAWLQELKRKIDSMQRKELLPFNAAPLSRRLARVLEAQTAWRFPP